MVGHDVMSPPLKAVRVNRANKVTELNSALTKELNWFTEMWNKERTAYLEAKGQVAFLAEHIKQLEQMVEEQSGIIDDLKKQVVELTKTHKKPKRQPSNYMKHKTSK